MNALQKVTDILELFLGNDEQLSLAELSKLSGLNKSTIYRIASYLVRKGYLKQVEKRGKYSLGMRFLDFSTVIKERVKIRDIAARYLIELKQIVKESSGLVVWDGQEATLIDTFSSNSVLRATPSEVSRLSLHATSAGKIFLSDMANEQLDAYMKKAELQKFTSRTITDHEELKKELISVRRQGLAYDIDEHVLGISSIAAGIRDNSGNIVGAAIVVAPSVRFTRQRLKQAVPHLQNCAGDISRELGWKENFKVSLHPLHNSDLR